jgi:meso-butanediol dehydrogenase/(S,S)-butanediol dehydrogenase/diacetyl reductase
MVRRFEGRTHAGDDIGAATARRLHAEGAMVVLSGGAKAKLDEVADSWRSNRYLVRPIDATVANDSGELVAETVSRFGTVDVLVNKDKTNGGRLGSDTGRVANDFHGGQG